MPSTASFYISLPTQTDESANFTLERDGAIPVPLASYPTAFSFITEQCIDLDTKYGDNALTERASAQVISGRLEDNVTQGKSSWFNASAQRLATATLEHRRLWKVATEVEQSPAQRAESLCALKIVLEKQMFWVRHWTR